MSSSFKDELLKEVSEQDSPVIRTDSLAMKFKTKKEEVAKALLELKQEGEIFFIIKPDGDLYITHINGMIEWEIKEENKEQKLFDREGNLQVDVGIFFDTISQYPEVMITKTKSYLKIFQTLRQRNMKKVLEINKKY